MSAPRSGEPSTSDKVLGAFVLAAGILMLALGMIEAVVAAISGDRQAAMPALIPLGLGLAVLALANACFSEAIDTLSWSEVLRQAQVLLCGDDRIDLSKLPDDVADPIRPLLPARTRYVTAGELRELFAEATALMAERARYARAERDALERHMEYEQTRAAAAYLDSLSAQDKALLELRLRARAAADARAVRDCERMAREIAALRSACEYLSSQFHCRNNSHQG